MITKVIEKAWQLQLLFMQLLKDLSFNLVQVRRDISKFTLLPESVTSYQADIGMEETQKKGYADVYLFIYLSILYHE